MERVIAVIQSLSLARNLETVMEIVRHAARELTRSDGATFVLRDGDQCFYAEEDAIEPLWKGRRFLLSECVSGWVMLNAKPAAIADVFSDSRVATDAYRPTFVKSMLMVPIRRQSPIGAIGSYWARHHEATDEEVKLLSALGDSVSIAMENVQLQAELEARVKGRTAELEASHRELEAFSYTVAHDLRAPLRSIDGFSQALLTEHAKHLDENGIDYLNRIRNSAQRMGHMIDALLNLSRVAGWEIQRRSVDLSRLLRVAKAELQVASPGRAVEVTIGEDAIVEGDEHLLQIAMTNLLSNAWKFTRNQSHSKIEFGQMEKEGQRVFYIRDNGAGFDMRYAPKLFGLFQRLHAVSEFEGTGVGLAVVKRIVQRHGGKIYAEGQKGEGASFFFSLPGGANPG